VAAVPRSTDTIAHLPLLLSFANGNHGSNNLVSWNTRKHIFSEMALLQKAVGVADATSQHFDKNLAILWCRDRNIFNCPWRANFLNDDSAA
jgi:hypothetical protein